MEAREKLTVGLVAKPGGTLRYHTGGWRTFRAVIDLEKCIGCRRCADSCPDGAPYECAQDGKKKKFCVDYDYCKGCGICAFECPVEAITMEKEEK